MMKTRILVIIAVLALLAVSCGEQEQQPDMASPFIGGNAAINMYLQEGLPPPTVFDGGTNPFAMGIVLENIGEADVGVGTSNPFLMLRLEGLLPANFAITDADLVQEPTIPLLGAKKNFDGTILPGQVLNAIYQPLNYLPDLQGNQVHTYRIVACYDYSTYATALLCMKNDVLENVQDTTICTLTGDKPVANSGAPIHITKVRQNPMDANTLQVNIEMTHVGTGEFYGRPEYMPSITEEFCDPNVRNTNKFNVYVDVNVDDPGSTVTCYRLGGGSEGMITMYQGSPQVLTCIVQGSPSAARVYQTALDIRVDYRYGEFIEDKFIVQAVPG